MRIGINGSFWNKARTGSGQYLRELLAALERCAPENQYNVILPENVRGNDLTTTSRIQFTPAKPTFGALGENVSKTWFEQVAFPRTCKREKVTLAHVPYFAAPLASPLKTVVTIHDLIPIVLPLYRGSPLVRLYTRLVSASARRAHAIIADSNCSKQDIVHHLGIPAERVHVIYLAANTRFRPVQNTDEVRGKYKLPERFILFLSGYDQRKNVRVLIEAFSRLADLYKEGYRLVLGGAVPDVDSPFFPNPSRMVRESGLPGDAVQFIGEVAEEDKPALYSSAAVFAFPSVYEGFGLPVLEAMACGTPVICSNTSSLPEVVGDAGLALDPQNVERWADSLQRVISDSRRREAMRAAGIQQASKFTWDRTARETLQVYERLVSI